VSVQREDNIIPHDSRAELAIIGSLLIDPECVYQVQEIVSAEMFYVGALRKLFSAFTMQVDAGKPLSDSILLADTLLTLGVAENAKEANNLLVVAGKAVNGTPSSMHVLDYAKLVRKQYRLREMMQASQKIVKLVCQQPEEGEDVRDVDAIIAACENMVFDAGAVGDPGSNAKDAKELMSEYFDYLSERRANAGKITGVGSGLTDLDQMTSGWQDSELILLAARPSMGKSAKMAHDAKVACEAGKGVLIFSVEMPRPQIMQRIVAELTKVDLGKLRAGDLEDKDWPRVANAIGHIENWNLTVDDTVSITIEQIRSRARRLVRMDGINVIFVDHIGLVTTEKDFRNRVQQIGHISRQLKTMARELKVPVVALSQLNRKVEQRADKRPMLSDLRDTGDLEADADVVIGLYRDGYYDQDSVTPNTLELIVAKQRNGPTGIVSVYYHPETNVFADLTQEELTF